MADPDVKYDKSLKTAGRYDPEGTIHSWLSGLLPSIFHPGGTITVNPDNSANVNTTVQHERVHAALDSLNGNGKLQQLNASNPFYKQVAAKIVLEPNTDANIEAPALAATGESSQMGIPPILSKQYMGYLQDQLFKLDPNLGQAYSKLANPVDTSQVTQ